MANRNKIISKFNQKSKTNKKGFDDGWDNRSDNKKKKKKRVPKPDFEERYDD